MVFIKKKQRRDHTAQKNDQTAVADEFQLKGFEFLAWAQAHMAGLIGAGIVLVLIVIGSLGWIWMGRTANEKASVAYHHAQLEASDPKKARAAFEKIVQDYRNSKVASLALLNVGQLSLELNEPSKAIEAFSAFLAAAGSKDTLRPLGLTGLGYAYDANRNPKKSLELFEQLSKGEIDVDTALWEVARLAKALGDKEKAKKTADSLIKKYPNSPHVAEAQSLLVSL